MPISPDLVEGNNCCWCQAGHGEVFSQVPSAAAFHSKTEKSDMAYGSAGQTKKSSVNDAGLVCPHRSGAGSDDRLLSSSWALGDCSVTETMGRDSVEPLQVREEQDPCPANMR